MYWAAGALSEQDAVFIFQVPVGKRRISATCIGWTSVILQAAVITELTTVHDHEQLGNLCSGLGEFRSLPDACHLPSIAALLQGL